jgi:uncharacterized protein YcgI (DUF1989 family)
MVEPGVPGELPQANGPESELIVPARYGRAFTVQAGQYLTVTDVEGKQVGDFVAFNAHDVHEYLHTPITRVHWNRIYPRVGDVFVSNLMNPVLEIVRDDVGQHDIARAICNPGRYEKHFGVTGHRSCLENLAEVLEPYGVERWWMPMPVNIFQNTPVMPDGSFDIREPLSKPGDGIVFRACLDLVCGLSACPMDLTPTNAGRITDLKVAVSNRPPAR